MDGKKITEEKVAWDETEHVVICDCGSELVFGIFEIIVLSPIFIEFLWMTCVVSGQLRTVYLSRHERELEKKRKKDELKKMEEIKKEEELKKLVRRELDVKAQGSRRGNGTEAIDTELK